MTAKNGPRRIPGGTATFALQVGAHGTRDGGMAGAAAAIAAPGAHPTEQPVNATERHRHIADHGIDPKEIRA